MVLAIAAVPVGIGVSSVALFRDRPRGFAIAGLIVSGGTGLLILGLVCLALWRHGPLW